jgi:hypothetical protein
LLLGERGQALKRLHLLGAVDAGALHRDAQHLDRLVVGLAVDGIRMAVLAPMREREAGGIAVLARAP